MSPRLDTIALGDGALALQSQLWATNSVLIPAGDDCLVCDPSIFSDEIDAVRARTRGFKRTHVLITHSDFDHVCGIPAFATDTVIAGATTAAAIVDGTARQKLDASGRDWDAHWDGELRVDLVITSDSVRCGGVEVVAIDSRGHIDDGSAFVIVDRRILLPGDYLSAVCHPVLLGSAEAAAASNERLLQAIADYQVSLVVPGHGPALTSHAARQIARADLDYIRSLQAAAANAVQQRASANAALLMAFAVQPPRRARPDFEAFDLLSANVRTALSEAGHEAFAGSDVDPDRGH